MSSSPPPRRWPFPARVTGDRPARTGRSRGPKDALLARLERNAIRERGVPHRAELNHRAALAPTVGFIWLRTALKPSVRTAGRFSTTFVVGQAADTD